MLDAYIYYIYYASKFFQQPHEVDFIVSILHGDKMCARAAPLPLGKLQELAPIVPLVHGENLQPPGDLWEVISGCSFHAYSVMT